MEVAFIFSKALDAIGAAPHEDRWGGAFALDLLLSSQGLAIFGTMFGARA